MKKNIKHPKKRVRYIVKKWHPQTKQVFTGLYSTYKAARHAASQKELNALGDYLNIRFTEVVIIKEVITATVMRYTHR